MYHEILPSHFHSNCQICCSLDYDLNTDSKNAFCVKKPKMKIKNKNPFPISRVPLHLFESILTKMHITSFTKMRRANKECSQYINHRRDFMRPALYHDKSIRFMFHWKDWPNKEPRIQLESTYFRTRSRREAKGTKGLFGIRETQEIIDNLRGSYFPTRTLWFHLSTLEQNYEIRRELSGCYIPVTISVDHDYSKLNGEEWEIFLLRFEQFLIWSGVKNQKVSFKISELFSSTRLWQICSMIRIHTVEFDHNRKWPYATNNSIFSESEVMFLNRCEVPVGTFDQFPKLQILHIDGDTGIYFTDLEAILENWVSGNTTLQEIQINAEVFYSDQIWNIFDELCQRGHATRLSKKQAMFFLKDGFPNFNRMWEDKTLRSYLLERKSTKKKAFCTIRGKHTYRSVSVKMLL